MDSEAMNLHDLEILCAAGLTVGLGLFCIAFVWAAMTLPANEDEDERD